MKKKNKLTDYSDEQIINILNVSRSFAEVIRTFGYTSIATGHYVQVKKELNRRNIQIPVYNFFGEHNNYSRRPKDENIFVNDILIDRQAVKKRILEENLIEYKCDSCGNNGEWQEKKLSLQLEHKNGDSHDNRLNNLCFLCPNCHSQTSTYARKKEKSKIKLIKFCKCGKEISSTAFMCINCNSKENRKVDRPDYEILMKEINETSQNRVAKKYGVSWRTIRKWRINYEKMDG